MKFFITAALTFLFSISCTAQPLNKYTGIWEGRLNLGVEVRIVFHINDDGNGGLKSSADSPDQSAYGLKCDTTFLSGEDLIIKMKALMASFTGKLIDESTIKGTFIQGSALPLTLKKVEKVSERIRPQTPKPPFPYKSEDIIYTNADKTLSYGATITIPEGTGPFPAAVLITGSGAQNRDEDILGHKLFAVIADYLTRNGFIILRVDDRGMGKSTGKFSEATSADFANDVSAGVDYLLSRPEVNKMKLGLIGHSEGGMIAPMVAVQRKDINFIVLLAGPGVKIIDLMTEQGGAVIRSSGASEKAVDAYKPLYNAMATAIVNAPDTTAAMVSVKKMMNDWAEKTNKTLLRELGLKDEKSQNDIALSLIRTMSSKWFKYFLSFDPQLWLEKLNCKVFALNGDKDIQVISRQNLPGIEEALKKSKSPSYEIKELPGLNHLFQKCKKCTVEEYGELEETFSPAALKIMVDWLIKNVN
jgi:pimeloyl-ACP methyl ester carboxylesterase